MKVILLLCVILSRIFGVSLNQISIEEIDKLLVSDGKERDNFGWSVAISGDIIVVGARRSPVITEPGSVYVYKRDSITKGYFQIAILTASDGEQSDGFGWRVAIDADTIVVGVVEDDNLNKKFGAAYIFVKPIDGWKTTTEDGILLASDIAKKDHYGWAVAISGDTVVVGSAQDNDVGTQSGSAYIFEKPINGWKNMTESAKITASDGAAYDYFGGSVSISNDTIIVGAERHDGLDTDTGAVYIFEKPDSGWGNVTENAILTASDWNAGDYFGTSIAIDGNTVVVGGHGNDDFGYNAGSAYLFEKIGDVWSSTTETTKLIASDIDGDDIFGWSVAISGDTAIVGSNRHDHAGHWSGAAYAFKKPDSGWSNIEANIEITASDAIQNGYFGRCVAIEGETIVVGAVGDKTFGTLSGATYVFKMKKNITNPSIIMYLLH